MDLSFVQEPELEFGIGDHVDIRFGLMNYRPFDCNLPTRPEKIRVAVIGTNESIDGSRSWLEKCRTEIEAKQSNKFNLYPPFPGIAAETGFRAELVLDDSLDFPLLAREFEALNAIPDYEPAIEAAVELYMSGVRRAGEKQVDVVLCAMSTELIQLIERKEAVFNARRLKVQFRDLLKAKAMEISEPLQLSDRPHTEQKSAPRVVRQNHVGCRTKPPGHGTFVLRFIIKQVAFHGEPHVLKAISL